MEVVPHKVIGLLALTLEIPRIAAVGGDIRGNDQVFCAVTGNAHLILIVVLLAEIHQRAVLAHGRSVRCGNGDLDRFAPRDTVVLGHTDERTALGVFCGNERIHAEHTDRRGPLHQCCGVLDRLIVGAQIDIRRMRKPSHQHAAVAHVKDTRIAVVKIGIVDDDRRRPRFAFIFGDVHRCLAEWADMLTAEGRCDGVQRAVFVSCDRRPSLIAEQCILHTVDNTVRHGFGCFLRHGNSSCSVVGLQKDRYQSSLVISSITLM